MNARSLFLLLISFLAGCASSRIEGVDVSAARAFYKQPTAQQLKTFRQNTVSDQPNLYFFGNQVRHPPAIYLARCFALNGKSAVVLLRSKLVEASGDLTVRDITMLFATIDAMGTYDVAGDVQLMRALSARVAKMQDEGWRDTAEKKIASIGHERNERYGNAPECS